MFRMSQPPSFYFLLAVLLGSFFSVAGCASGPVPSRSTPKETFRAFAKNIAREEYSKAYAYLSKDTQKRYKLNHFWGMFKKTRAGALLRWKVKNWEIADVDRPEEDNAFVEFRDPEHPERRNRYELVMESAGQNKTKHVWRIRFYLADELNIPRHDEELYFGEKTAEKTSTGDGKDRKSRKSRKKKKNRKNNSDNDREENGK